MSDADTTSEDEDYEPNNAEVQEAEADAKRKRKWETSEKDSAVRKLRVSFASYCQSGINDLTEDISEGRFQGFRSIGVTCCHQIYYGKSVLGVV